MVAEYEHLYSAIRDLGSPRSVRELLEVVGKERSVA